MLTVLYVLGLTAESMTAALAAGRQRMDMFGVMLIAAVTCLLYTSPSPRDRG